VDVVATLNIATEADRRKAFVDVVDA